MNSSARALRTASQSSASVASGAVQQVVADRAVQQRGVLGDHADLCAQAFLADLGDVLAVDQDAPACTSYRRSSRLTRVDLPAPDGPIRPIFSPGDVQVEAAMTRSLAVVKVHVLETHFATATFSAGASGGR
jgi:hypothetical protein